MKLITILKQNALLREQVQIYKGYAGQSIPLHDRARLIEIESQLEELK
jgi:hypothetical protein